MNYVMLFWVAVSAPYLIIILGIIAWKGARFIGTFVFHFAKRNQIEVEEVVSVPQAVVWLVHGTFAPNAPWTRKGSKLRQKIVQSIEGDVQFRIFNWSGRNSIVARRKASNRLTQELIASVNEKRGVPHYVVAHSHGGNIAMRTISSSSHLATNVRLVCLSTPFLVAHRRPRTFIMDLANWVLPLGVLIVGSDQLEAWGWIDNSDEYAVPLMVVGLILGWIWNALGRRTAEDVLQDCRYNQLADGETFFIRTSQDEASLAIGAATLLNRLIHRLVDWPLLQLESAHARSEEIRGSLVNGLPILLVTSVATCALAIWASFTTTQSYFVELVAALTTIISFLSFWLLGYAFLGGGWLLFVILLFFSILLLPAILALVVLSFAAGLEMALVATRLELSAESTPAGRWHVVQINAADQEDMDAGSARLLQHSLSYEDARALDELGYWFETRKEVPTG